MKRIKQAALVGAIAGATMVLIGVAVGDGYGALLIYAGAPFLAGIVSGFVYGLRARPAMQQYSAVATLTVAPLVLPILLILGWHTDAGWWVAFFGTFVFVIVGLNGTFLAWAAFRTFEAWNARLDRAPFALAMLALTVVKLMTQAALWYWPPLFETVPLELLGMQERVITAQVALAFALPLFWGGVLLVLRRLRSAGWPRVLAVLFLVPYVNAALVVALHRAHASRRSGESAGRRAAVA